MDIEETWKEEAFDEVQRIDEWINVTVRGRNYRKYLRRNVTISTMKTPSEIE